MTVIVPAFRKESRDGSADTEMRPSPTSGSADAGEWKLSDLFGGSTQVSTPSQVAWHSIKDRRIDEALQPRSVWGRRYLGPRAVVAQGIDGANDQISHAFTDDSATDDTHTMKPPAARETSPAFSELLGAAEWLRIDSVSGSSAPLPAGVAVRAIEVLDFEDWANIHSPARQVFVVIHLLLREAALRDPGTVAAYFGPSSGKTDERTGYSNSDNKKLKRPLLTMHLDQWDSLLRKLGLQAIDADARKRGWRPFIISHLVPDPDTPAAPFAATPTLAHWDDTQLWAWRMGGGQRMNQGWEPGRGADDPTRDGTWIGSTWCRASLHGLAFVATRGVGERATTDPREGAVWWRAESVGYRNLEHTKVAALVHRNAVYLAILSMRQALEIQDLGVRLATDIAWPKPLTAAADVGSDQERSTQYVEQATEVAEVALKLELDLLQMRNRLWFTQIPELPVESRVLQVLQSAARTPVLLADIESEQQQVTAGLHALAVRVKQVQDRAAQDENEKVNTRLSRLSAFLGVFFVFDLALSLVQTYTAGQYGGWGPLLTAVIPAALVAALLTVYIHVLYTGRPAWLRRLIRVR